MEHSAGELVEILAGLDEKAVVDDWIGPFNPEIWHIQVAILIKKAADAVSMTAATQATSWRVLLPLEWPPPSPHNKIIRRQTGVKGFWPTDTWDEKKDRFAEVAWEERKYRLAEEAREIRHAVRQALQEWASHLSPGSEVVVPDVFDDASQALRPTSLGDADEVMQSSSGLGVVAVDGASSDVADMEVEYCGQVARVDCCEGIDGWDGCSGAVDFGEVAEQTDMGDTLMLGYPSFEVDDNTEDGQRRRAFLRDMMGQEEAPFFPTDFGP